MWKLVISIIVSGVCSFISGMIIAKLITIYDLKNNIVCFFQGVRDRFDRAMTGNDGIYSSTRLQEFLWSIGALVLIFVCVLKTITIQDGILYLIGAAIGVGGIKNVLNKANEIKTNLTVSQEKKDDSEA